MDDLTEYKRLLCHSFTLLDVGGEPDPFTGGKERSEWLPVVQKVPCRVSGSPGRIQKITGRQATPQDFLMHTLYADLKAGMRLKIEQPEFAGNLYEVSLPYPVYGAESLHHYEVVIAMIDPVTGEEPEI
ncbi:hypothetical protein [Brevibacillus brevis]|uniref:hypothetical protein n=1 Tax=Brevibacillus brevis TaxID=1393 RepID=UPI000D0E412C|nr:hypothetical protein [Brevibacillus brevis]PSJ66295.1 hypothetical protein C7J99_26525 [Brevibacillus brevis]RED21804.1 hypothetical protein DES34_11869 [Brevibacillus brevis]GEC92430.1 hypothetical protein BBR01nite_47610 [Brevibacillus brevis]VEF92667.1 Uncharacterised protein [Brevibacillus brevis]